MTSAIRIRSGPVLCSAAFGMCLALGAGPVQAQKTYEGVEVNLLTRPGPVIAGRLEERGKEFEEMTGARINVSSVPFADLFQKLLTDWATGTNSIDVGVFASGWAVELVDGGLLADLSEFVANDPELKIDDVAPYFREFNQKIDGKTYLITIDGDFQMVYYRKDVLDELGLRAAQDLGRVSRGRRRGQRQGHERRRRRPISAPACSRSATPRASTRSCRSRHPSCRPRAPARGSSSTPRT